jgi:serine/threonine protein kinase
MRRRQRDFPLPENQRKGVSSPVLGNWILERKLGQGGFGTVFLAYRSSNKGGVKERAAIKVINSHLRDQEDYEGHVARFMAEFKVLQRLESPFCAKVLDGEVTAETPWMATQFISGDSLAEEIRHEGPLPADLWWLLAADLLTGLTEAHAKGIIHRDIKPQNVMRGVRGSVLIDFGIAKLVGNPKLTAQGSPMTPAYASPEQLMGKDLTAASDLFSLGHTLLFAASGRLGFPSENIQSLVAGILNGAPDLGGLDSQRARFISKLMSREPSSRLSSREALAMGKASLGQDPKNSTNRDMGVKEVKKSPPARKGIGNVRLYLPRNEASKAGQLRSTSQKITARIAPRAGGAAASKGDWGDFERRVINFLIRAGRSQFLLPISAGDRRDIYFQGFFDTDGRLTLEAVSNNYLDVKMSSGQIQKMVDLGWELPSEALPNFIKFLELDESKKPRVAKLMVESLRAAYGVLPGALSIDSA